MEYYVRWNYLFGVLYLFSVLVFCLVFVCWLLLGLSILNAVSRRMGNYETGLAALPFRRMSDVYVKFTVLS